ncbi:MAG: prepilin-type N-terminal cleavage/methylation domain-containing protein [Candidatus Saccharibacteria bacterium]|nr:prepilin-type N-terminal cleavage/methylation domain-containing protein [Moraxellaceae bacterium]
MSTQQSLFYDWKKQNAQQGFTLIEVMLVVLIAGVFAAMVSLSVGGSETRRVLQEREQLVNSISVVRLESEDQGRMLGLLAVDQTAAEPARYFVMQFDPNDPNKDKRWKPAAGFKVHPLPTGVILTVSPLQDNSRQTSSAPLNDITSSILSPKLIWFGNGEATAARLQLSQEGQPIGDAVEVTTLGRVKKEDTRLTDSSSENGQ